MAKAAAASAGAAKTGGAVSSKKTTEGVNAKLQLVRTLRPG